MPRPSTPSIINIACAYQIVARHKAQSAPKNSARPEFAKVDYHALFIKRVSKPASISGTEQVAL